MSEAPTLNAPTPNAPTRILVVDDDDGGRYLKAHILRKSGYAVTEAATGRAAIEQCEAARPELVLLDMRLPDTSGVEVCRQIRTAYPATAVLQTSAAITSPATVRWPCRAAPTPFLIEPIEPEELLATVKALLRMRSAEHALRRMNETLENLIADRTTEIRPR